MKKQRTPLPISTLIERCLIKLEDMLDQASNPANVKDIVSSLIQIEKNEREHESEMKEKSDQELFEEMDRLKGEP